MHKMVRSLCAAPLAVLLGVSAALAQFSGGGAPAPAGMQRVICSVKAANFNSTADQACPVAPGITAWSPTSIVVTNCTVSMTLAAGGVYPATAKGGTALVAAAQVYTALTAASVTLGLTLAGGIATTRYTIGTAYLSLTTAQGAPATCDFFILGSDLS